jgi:hypothetical protein
MVISREIKPLAALYPPPLFRAVLRGRRRRYAHAYGNCAPFYCISLNNIYGGGGNAAKGLISRVIAKSIITIQVFNFGYNLENDFYIQVLHD